MTTSLFVRRPRPFLAPSFALVVALAGCRTAPEESEGASESAQTAADISEKDVAIAFSSTSVDLVGVGDTLRSSERLFPRAWYDAVDGAFRQTEVDAALTVESRYEDWKVVSARIAACAALGPTPSSDVDRLCWPEVRLVLQPIVRNVRIHERTSEAYVDDRAIHAIYPVATAGVLSSAEEARARELRIKASTAKAGTPFAPLSPVELSELEGLRTRVTSALVTSVRGLRGAFPTARYVGVGVRPESDEGGAESRAFRARFTTFLSTFTRPGHLSDLTAFSLPEGREPAHLDTWVFLAFTAQNGRLVPKNLTVTSKTDGAELFSFGRAETVSTGVDDPRIVEAIARGQGRTRELTDTIVSRGSDIARLTPVLRDRRQRLVPNTSCGSCHKMNSLRFDFHNFGYLEDRDLTVSPRVTTDVELDLKYLRRK